MVLARTTYRCCATVERAIRSSSCRSSALNAILIGDFLRGMPSIIARSTSVATFRLHCHGHSLAGFCTKYRIPQVGVHYAAAEISLLHFSSTFLKDLSVHLKG